MARSTEVLKRVVLGPPMATSAMGHTLLPKAIALPVFSSDALSSVAYATQEILLVLGAAGAVALSRVVPISIAVACLLALVVASYRQTVRAYPMGGGAYRVSRENLGVGPGLLAASALLIDYVLTVSVSITAGTQAVLTAAPGLGHLRVEIAMLFIAFVATINLRGVKESGVFFAVPTYLFMTSMAGLLLTAFVKCLGGCPVAASAGTELHAHSTLGAFLILRAFAAGTTALTGVEAIADGVPAFRYPQSKNAATTLAIMGTMSISMFLGVSWLADRMHVRYVHGQESSVLGDIAHAVFGGGFGFYAVQVATAAILILAANTAFADFPRLASILATDRFLPRQLMNRGDRLVFSNGVVALSILAALLIVVFRADLNRLIQLYLVGVFVSFTLSQTGMVVHWRRARRPGWRRSIVINAVGATTTGIVLCVVIATKFTTGAWIVVAGIPLLMLLMRGIHHHYAHVAAQLALPERRPADRRPGEHSMAVLVETVDASVAHAVGFVRSVRPRASTAILLDKACAAPFKRLAPEIPIAVLDRRGGVAESIKAFLARERSKLPSGDFYSLVVPELLERRTLWHVLRRPRLQRLKASFLSERGVQLVNVPVIHADLDEHRDECREPARNYVVVLVAGVHNATLQAIEYAETLNPTDLRAVSFGLDPAQAERLAEQWMDYGIQLPLELDDSPYRDIGRSLVDYVGRFEPDGVDTVVTVVIPEFVVAKARHQLLHGQTALLVKRHLLFQRGVVVASVPYLLEDDAAP
ncbi:MAG TPA: APC family permease [Actinomycetota bacterium]|nr:APC family permease [Actinomycetota bacterium]